jgi:hypothetical protein
MADASRIPEELGIALVEATASITGGILQHAPAEFHNQLVQQIDGIIKTVMTSLATHYRTTMQ